MNDLDSFLATVDEFVDDENRIVTYKWLSQQLAISANKAKSILTLYAKSNKKGNNNAVHVIYTIIGRNSSGMCVKVVRDDDLDAAKSKLEKVISISMYSVQKAKLIDSSVLYAADFDNDRNNLAERAKLGSIIYSGSMKISKDDIKQQKPQVGAKTISSELEKQFAKPEKNKNTQQKVNFFGKTKTSPTNKKGPEKGSVLKGVDPVKSNTVTAPKRSKTGVAAFLSNKKNDPFAKSKTGIKKNFKEEAKTENSEDLDTEPKKVESDAKKSDKKNDFEKELDIDDFPNDSDFVPKKSKKEEKKTKKGKQKFEEEDLTIDEFPDAADFVPKKKAKKGKQKLEEENLKIDEFPDATDFMPKKDTNKSKSKKLSPKTNLKSSKKKTRNDSSELPAKKRRRIQEMSSSSSEDEDTEEMDIEPPSPPPILEQVIPPSPPSLEQDIEIIPENVTRSEPVKNKRKKKVLKTKTFVDDEGCMVTEKYYDYEETDEAEPPQVANGNSDDKPEQNNDKSAKEVTEIKKKKMPSESTASQPKKQQKQASIMGFFKKK